MRGGVYRSGPGQVRQTVRRRFWWVMGQLWLIRARRCELRALRCDDLARGLAQFKAAERLKKKAEEFFRRIGSGATDRGAG
ncbi:hypothetical protein [Pseudorhodobacter sp.]|uniref:hypothetical protein n=1 Tax=Pseudorhodobacter sp. TaxID=1934400 RepID=UPI0026479A79|nr:hypothetical protein [Pseudorhodobacter sp.]MDN5789034.1 hypothetical protein [Pseudorhodobacter sp.]